MYHPAAALRTPAIERESYADIAAVPSALIDARRRREAAPEPPDRTGRARNDRSGRRTPPRPTRTVAAAPAPEPAAADAAPQLTLF